MLHRIIQGDLKGIKTAIMAYFKVPLRYFARVDGIIIIKNPRKPEHLSQGPKLQPAASEA